MSIELINFLDTEVVLDRLEFESRKVGMTMGELWVLIQIEHKTIDHWRKGTHTPTLGKLQHIQNVINDYIRSKHPNAEFIYVA